VSQHIRTAVRVEGIVQGVGFRPFVYSLATSLGLAGLVGNDADGVFAEVEGPPEAVEKFLLALERDAPPLARIERITTAALPLRGSTSFSIALSESGAERRTLVSADTATCPDCLAELIDPGDRRFGYPFINCTNCGPRFTIVRDVPYDRPLTTMASFVMCGRCAAEYHDPANRRFHAQPICCPACGPRLSLLDREGAELSGQPLAAAAGLLRQGMVLAVKGLGGYHLAVDASSEDAAAALRARKHREDKPFAVMVADVPEASRLCEVDEAAAALLASGRRPIVLLPRRPGAGVAPSVAPGNRQLGVMLPYTPLHHLLLQETGRPMVLTSGNVSDEPIVYRDGDAAGRLSEIADAFLTHDRPIQIRTDDSVVRAFRGRGAVIRRSRGYVPEPIAVHTRFARPVLACGAELKNTFCLAKGGHAFISHHIGDLENAETLQSFAEGIEHFRRLFDITPEVIAHDLHPEYLSTKYALDLAERGVAGAGRAEPAGAGPAGAGTAGAGIAAGAAATWWPWDADPVEDPAGGAGSAGRGSAGAGEIRLVGVQHHHAHIASCLADNGEDGPVIGVAFDGTGFGTDGTIWGGEFLIADLTRFERGGHLAPVPMPGGAAAIRQPWRMAAAYLDDAYPDGQPDGLEVARRNQRHWSPVITMARRGINSPVTSSAGRLFDAVAAILGVRDEINYEGQAAVELEQLADPAERGAYTAAAGMAVAGGEGGAGGAVAGAGGEARAGETAGPLVIAGRDLVRAVVDDLAAGTSRNVIAARFHNGVAGLITQACLLLRDRHGLSDVALSGGVFQNLLLLHAAAAQLEEHGFRVLVHSRVPCNDGGISLGQAVIAAATIGPGR
jgi:hydrogenase maturation protein HypF